MQMPAIPISLNEISHELRTSLTGILNGAQFLNDGFLTSEQQSYVDIIGMAGNRILALTQLLTEKQNANHGCVASS